MAKKINPMLAIVGGLFAVLLLFAVISVILYPGPTISEAADGDTLNLFYRGTYDNGTVFDYTEEGQTYEVILGQHTVISGFEDALYGMKVNETKVIKLTPDQAYPYDPNLIQTFNKTEITESLGSVPEVGDEIIASNGLYSTKGVVKEVTPTTVIIDFNRETAGQNLTFEITVVEIHKGSGEGTH